MKEKRHLQSLLGVRWSLKLSSVVDVIGGNYLSSLSFVSLSINGENNSYIKIS